MKKRSILSVLLLSTIVGVSLAGCQSQDNPNPNPNPGPNNPVEDTFEITLIGNTTRTLEIGKTDLVKFEISKNGVSSNEDFVYEIQGEAISFDKNTKTITALKAGKSTLIIKIKNHEESMIQIVYDVIETFFSRDIQRGDVNFANEGDGSVAINGGEATVVAKKSATKFIFKTTVTLPKNINVGTTSSFGIGSFVNNGDNALWFGLRNDDGANDNIYSNYIRSFYDGWGAASFDGLMEGYENCSFDGPIKFELIRDGANYYYSINNYYQKFVDEKNYDKPTYPGIYSQKIPLTLSEYSVEYDEAKIKEAIDGYDKKPLASVKIKEKNKFRLLRGFSYQYTADAYPLNPDKKPELEWSIDKTFMTTGKENTTVKDGNLTIAPDASGSLTLICKAKGNENKDTLKITILEKADEKENDIVKVTGGVELDDQGKITFPKEMIDIDGVINEQTYADATYSAVLKNKLQRDFSIEFTVSNYVTKAQFPKLQFALGGGNNNFYVAYKPDGTCRVEAFARGLFNDGQYRDGWFNSESFDNFNKDEPHNFKISVLKDGAYEVYLDGKKLSFNMDGQNVILKRDFENFVADSNVKIATRGVSAEVSNLKVANGVDEKLPTFWKYNSNTTLINDKEFKMRLTSLGRGTKDNYGNRIIKTERLTNDFVIEYDVDFSDATSDSKFVMKIGSFEYHVNNKIATATPMLEGYIFRGAWGGENINVTNKNTQDMLKAHVRLERKGTHIRYIVNDVVVGEDNNGSGDLLEFFAFNQNQEYADTIIHITNLSIAPYSMKNYYLFELIGSASRDLEVGKQNKIEWNLFVNNVISKEGTFKVEVENTKVIKYDEATQTVTGLIAGTSKVTIYCEESKTSVEVNYKVSGELLENDLLKVNGGAKLNPDGSIVFPKELEGVDGVGNEQDYDGSITYNATLKETVVNDFSIEFTVSNYVSKEGEQYPKLMVSLGGKHNNFYIAYKPNGEYRVESFTDGVDENGNLFEGGNWNNSANFVDFDKTKDHTFKISVVEGVYHVFMDGNELSFNMDNSKRTLARSFESYTTESPIRFGTKGASCVVKNIKLEKNTKTKNFYHTNDQYIKNITDNGFDIIARKEGWDETQKSFGSKCYLTKLYNNDKTIEFDLGFSKEMKDGKFVVSLGNDKVMINNKNGAISGNIINWDEGTSDANFKAMHIKIVVKGKTIQLFINDVLVKTQERGSENVSEYIDFYVFNTEEGDKEVAASVSNLTIK